MNEFTKGEWTVVPEGLDDTLPSKGYLSIQPIDAYIDHGRNPITNEDRANARLIAAAPELLKVCKELLENEPFGVTPYFDEALEKMKTIITKI